MTSRRLLALAVAILVVGTAITAQAGPARTGQARKTTAAAGPAAQDPPQTTPAPGRGAQGRGARPAGPAGRGGIDPAKLATVQDLLDAVELSDADKFLELNEQQYGGFIQRLKKMQQLRRQHGKQRQRLVAELRQMVTQKPPVEDALLEAPTKRLDEFERTAAQEMLTARTGIDEILNLRQRARFRVFEENLERQKVQILARVFQAGSHPQ